MTVERLSVVSPTLKAGDTALLHWTDTVRSKGLLMPSTLQAAFFDVDGVLIDSLSEHLQICRDEALEFGLKLRVPTIDEFRELIRRGTKIGPMRYFFLAVGFPEPLVGRAVAEYEKVFMERYRPKAFPEIDKTLATLRKAGLKIGLVTANTRDNVVPALGESMKYFEEQCLFFWDRYPTPKTKHWCLVEGARILGIEPGDCAYIGDQPSDASAAAEAGTRFLGVTYGWGIAEGDKQYQTAKSVSEIADRLIAWTV
jgi:phosphoglycolate phosphatase-like HAD superfamily hydrolase